MGRLSGRNETILDGMEGIAAGLEDRIRVRLRPRVRGAGAALANAAAVEETKAFLGSLETATNVMALAHEEFNLIVEQARVLALALGQERHAMAPDQPRAGFQWGADQWGASRAAAQYVDDCKRVLLSLARDRLGCDDLHEDPSHHALVLAHELMFLPEQHSSFREDAASGKLELLATLSTTWWQAYIPRYFSNLAHEAAHPFVQLWIERLGDGKGVSVEAGKTYVTLEQEVKAILERNLGSVVRYFAGYERVVCAEILTDIAALWATGPAFAASLSTSMLGTSHIRASQRLGQVPTVVRLEVLRSACESVGIADAHWARTMLDVADLARDSKVKLLEYRGAGAKLEFWKELGDAGRKLTDFFFDQTKVAGIACNEATPVPDGPQSATLFDKAGKEFRRFLGQLPSSSPPNMSWLDIKVEELPGIQPGMENFRPVNLPNLLWKMILDNAPTLGDKLLSQVGEDEEEGKESRSVVFPELRATYRWHDTCQLVSNAIKGAGWPTTPHSGGKAGKEVANGSFSWGGCYQLTFFDFVYGKEVSENAFQTVKEFKQHLLDAVSSVSRREGGASLCGVIFGPWDALALTPGFGWREPDRWATLLDATDSTWDRHSLHAIQEYSGDCGKYRLQLDGLADSQNRDAPLILTQMRFAQGGGTHVCEPLAELCRLTDHPEGRLHKKVSLLAAFASAGWEEFVAVFRLDAGLGALVDLHRDYLAMPESRVKYLRTVSQPLIDAWSVGADGASHPLYDRTALSRGRTGVPKGWRLAISTRVRVAESRRIREVASLAEKCKPCEAVFVFGEPDLIVRKGLVPEAPDFGLVSYWNVLREMVEGGAVLSCDSSMTVIEEGENKNA